MADGVGWWECNGGSAVVNVGWKVWSGMVRVGWKEWCGGSGVE